MLNNESRPVKPAAIAAMATRCSGVSALNLTPGNPINEPAKISCSIGEAMPITPMPAETLRHSTHQISQNCGVLCALSRCTLCCEIIAFDAAGGVQPSGRQPVGGSR